MTLYCSTGNVILIYFLNHNYFSLLQQALTEVSSLRQVLGL